MFIQIIFLIFGFAILITGANLLVKGSSKIAKIFNVSEIIIGLTIVALGTSLPELLVSIISATTEKTDIVMGNAIGSNLCNLLLILGIVAILKPVRFEKETITKDLPILIVITLFIIVMSLGIFINTKMVINKLDGYILLLFAAGYFLLPIIEIFKQKKEELKEQREEKKQLNNENKKYEIMKNISYVLLGGIALKYGGDFAVNSAVNISHMLGISERVIGLTIVSLGTSLPELITSVVAIIKGNDDLAEGNIIGSSIINASLILGGGAVIADIPLTSTHIEDLSILLVCTIIIWLFGASNKKNILNRFQGAILVFMYIIYTMKLFM